MPISQHIELSAHMSADLIILFLVLKHFRVYGILISSQETYLEHAQNMREEVGRIKYFVSVRRLSV